MLAWVVIYRCHLGHSTPIPSSLRTLRLCVRFSDSSLRHSPLSPIFRIFFQVPYPVSPAIATLTKTAGVCTNNSHSGTHQSRVQFSSLVGLSLTPIPIPYTLSPFPSYSCALSCAFLHSPKLQFFSFQEIPHSLLKIPGGGVPILFVPRGQEASHPR